MLTPDQTKLRLVEAENRKLKEEVARLSHNYKVALESLLKMCKDLMPALSASNRLTTRRNIEYIQKLLDSE